jgi:tRNA(His) 5'-end guanylyltransferase
MNKVSLGDRMKLYEDHETSRTFIPLLPIIVRLDGKSFHSFTRGLQRPYDERMSQLMKEVTKQLVTFSSAKIGYTQSDEITLVLYSDNLDSQVFFDGSVFKTISILASFASATFNKFMPEYLPEKEKEIPLFDCRAWNVPSKDEAVNCLIWRELDATKNSISMAAQSYFPHKQLIGKTGSDKQEMLFSVGINWNDYPAFFKRGVYIQRRKVVRKYTVTEIDKLPLKHNARSNPDLEIERTDIFELDMQLMKVSNKNGVVFDGQEPLAN